ncbi:MAG: VanZ family protein [Halobacteriota archaeon]
MTKPNKLYIKLTLTCLYAVFLFYLSSLSIPPEPHAPGFLYGLVGMLRNLGLQFLLYPLYLAHQYPDKFFHLLLYMGFGLLLNLTLRHSSRLSKYAAPLAIFIGTVYGITDEFHQSLVPYRTASIFDLYTDLLGLLIAQLLLLFYFRLKRYIKARYRGSTPTFDLMLVLIFDFLALLFVLIPPFNQLPLRLVFAVPILLFLPGYALIAAMFPRKDDLSAIERFTLSIGLSIAIFVFDGFAISVTAWRFRPLPLLLTLSLITVTLVLITFVVRLRIPEDNRYHFDSSSVSQFIDSIRESDEKPGEIEKALIIALVGSIIIASGMLIYAKVTFEEEKFTAFYILGNGGKAEDYPPRLYLLEPGSLIVGIENYEHAPTNYTLELKLGGYLLVKQQIPTLVHGDKWKEAVSFTPRHAGKHMELEFLLYKGQSTSTYRSVHLWMDSVIDYDNLAALRAYVLSNPPEIRNPDMESESDWAFTESGGYFRGFFSKFYRMDENATLSGYVTDNVTGLPIPDALVTVRNHYGYERHNTTNETGYYEQKIVAGHFWTVVTANSYKKSETDFEMAPGQSLMVNLTNDPIMLFNMTIKELTNLSKEIKTLPAEEIPKNVSAFISGYVVDNETELPIANATLKIRSNYGIGEWNDTTDENGYYAISLIAGPAGIAAEAAGYMSNITQYEVDLTNESRVDLRLTPENSFVAGYIVENSTGVPIPDAYLRVNSRGYNNYTRSNGFGFYSLKTIAGHIKQDVSKEDYFSNSTEFNVSYGETITVNMTMAKIPPPPPKATIYGFVSCNGTRLPAVRVAVSDHKGYEKATLTDSKGYFEIETVPGHLWLDVLPGVYLGTTMEFELKSGGRAFLDVEVNAFPESTYQIEYPSETPITNGQYGGIYQDLVLVSREGLATLSFKVSDSHNSNRSEGSLYKQVLLNDHVVWEDDVAENEGWQEVEIPLTLDNGTNRLTLRVYAKQDTSSFPVTVWWDDVRIKRFEAIMKQTTTSFYIHDANGGVDNYPAELYLGEPAKVIAGIENQEHEPVTYLLQVKLGGVLLETETVKLDDGSTWEQQISFTPTLIGPLQKLEFLLYKNKVTEEPYKEFHLWVHSDIDYNNLDVLSKYVVSPLPEIVNGDMESSGGWMAENATNFTVRLTDSAYVSPTHSYETSYMSTTAAPQGSYAGIYQNVTTWNYPAVVVLMFNVKDSCTEDKSGYFAKQVLLGERVIWEADVAGDEGWEHVTVPVTLNAATTRLVLRVYTKGEGADAEFPVDVWVWWDDVKTEVITGIPERATSSFYVRDVNGTEQNYPTKLHLGEPAEVLVGVRNSEPKERNYVLQIKLDGRLLKTRTEWVDRMSSWAQKISFVPDKVGENQKLEFLLYRDYVKGEPYKRFYLWVTTTVNFDDLVPLLRYGIHPHPKISDGEMNYLSAWTTERTGSFSDDSNSEEYVSPPRSYCVKQYEETNTGDYMALSQHFYVPDYGVAVISFNVRDSYTETSRDADNITKQVLLNGNVLWDESVSGSNEGYEGWVAEEYDLVADKWEIKNPWVKSGWELVDIPVYLKEGNSELTLRVCANGAAKELPVKVYWDDVKIKPLHELVKAGENVRMKRYGR